MRLQLITASILLLLLNTAVQGQNSPARQLEFAGIEAKDIWLEAPMDVELAILSIRVQETGSDEIGFFTLATEFGKDWSFGRSQNILRRAGGGSDIRIVADLMLTSPRFMLDLRRLFAALAELRQEKFREIGTEMGTGEEAFVVTGKFRDDAEARKVYEKWLLAIEIIVGTPTCKPDGPSSYRVHSEKTLSRQEFDSLLNSPAIKLFSFTEARRPENCNRDLNYIVYARVRPVTADMIRKEQEETRPPVGCGLGKRWIDMGSGGWTGTYTQRSNSNVFDARWTDGSSSIGAVITIRIEGNRVLIDRPNQSDGNNCKYEGTIGPDSVTVTGTTTCTGTYPGRWTDHVLKIECEK